MSEASPRNLTSYEGARELACELDDWWHSRGYTRVTHWVVEAKSSVRRGSNGPTTIWCVRSNLIGGLPPETPEHAA